MTFERHVKVGDTVKIDFIGRFETGEEFDRSTSKNPLIFKVASDEVIPGVDEAVVGMKVNQSKTLYINPDKAYGPVTKELIISVSRDKFPENIELELGHEFEIPDEDGHPISVRITKITDEQIELDGNHPLAGKNLIFDIKLLEIE
ncbi:MAG: FKBP-type peptidyl-prolyl cis-trans isomerase [Melioribacteraceae bacterium]|nr:FKBP-type peptidyl-prolyl cis-trans isomerase [Melioribacteraceae bacterium]